MPSSETTGTGPLPPWPSLRELARQVRTGERSAVDLAREAMDRVARRDASLHSVLYVDGEGALAQAAVVDRAVAAGRDPGPLAGVPVLLKDNLCTRGVPTTCASRMLQGWLPPYDATVVERLRVVGAVPLGKANLDEFAMGSSGEHSAFGPTRNPLDTTRVPGGSSSGSAAAVAAGLVPATLGSDTGGSVRLPAAFCGVAALKPTYGRISRYGLVAFGSSLDQVGPIARSVDDLVLLLAALAGHDPRDATSATEPTDDLQQLAAGGPLQPPQGPLRAGVLREAMSASAPQVAATLQRAFGRLRAAGWRLEEVELPLLQEAVAVYYVVASVEAASNLARFDGVRYGHRGLGRTAFAASARGRAEAFGPEVQRRILLGTFAAAEGLRDRYYLRAQRLRAVLTRRLREALARFDVLLAPTAPTVAFRLGERLEDPMAMYRTDLCTLPASLAGLPALSVPVGQIEGLPVGLQLLGRPFGEVELLRAARAVEQLAGMQEEAS